MRDASPFSRPRFIPPHMLLLLVVALLLGARFLPEPRWLEMPWNLLGFVCWCRGSCSRPPRVVSSPAAGPPFGHSTRARRWSRTALSRWSRNPMYTGLTAALLGLAILVGNAVSFLAPLIFALWVRWAFIRREEVYMRQQFGAAYTDYCRRVRRWL